MGVIYLVWLPYGIEHFKKFIDSYIKYEAAYPHQLVIAFNGLASNYDDKPEKYLAYLESKSVPVSQCLYYQTGQDIEIYRQAATEINTDFLLFFNTYSQLQTAGWLKLYTENFDDRTGLIGASGSGQSYYSSVFQKHTAKWEAAKGFLYNFRKYKLFIKAFFYWRFLFKPFPSLNIRTNAFMVRRKEFLELKAGTVNTKFKAYQFESGRKSMTKQLQQMGYKTLVLDKHGKTYEPAKWRESSTFWISGQENLLVSDNQTRIYTAASVKEKKEMAWLAWGIK